MVRGAHRRRPGAGFGMNHMKSMLNLGVLLRVLLDVVLISLSLLAAFLVRFVYAIAFEGPFPSGRVLLGNYLQHFAIALPLILVLSLLCFAYFGLYNRTRSYNWRAKAITVSKAVTVPYLLIPLTLFVIPDVFTLPRSVLFIGWAFTWATVLLARTWSTLWRHLMVQEGGSARAELRDERKVLLIGGAGYIGSALLPKLLHAGYKVRLLDVLLYGKEPLGQCIGHPALELVEGDFRQV